MSALHTVFVLAGAAFGGSSYADPEPLCRIEAPEVVEASGLAASRAHADLYWVHNDSGDGARIYAVTAGGRLAAVVEVAGAAARDWEDVALGPATEPEGRDSIYIADTGNNRRIRDDLCVYRFPEPEVDPDRTGVRIRSEPAERFRFHYPGGGFDCEALVVHPERPVVYLFTKELLGSVVFRLDVETPGAGSTPAERVGRLDAGGLVTAAALAPDGRRLALRFYWGICEYRSPPGRSVFDHLDAPPCWIRPPAELQGEALAFSRDGTALLTVGEGSHPVIYRLRESR